MTDREKTIEGLETIRKFFSFGLPSKVPKFETYQNILTNTIVLLKEQEAVKPKTGHWIFESAYCEAWSHTCSECGKRMTTAYNTYANYCSNCGAKMER